MYRKVCWLEENGKHFNIDFDASVNNAWLNTV
jgi:hypothetical protein